MTVARVRLNLNRGQVNQIGMDEARRHVLDMARATLNRANVLTPVRTGNLRGHNDMRLWETGLIAYGEVFNAVEYAAAVHNGADPRIIRAKPRAGGRQGALRFRVGGRYIYRKEVSWPGTRPRPWLTTATIQVAPQYGFEIVNV
jgi:hypothetical protein